MVISYPVFLKHWQWPEHPTTRPKEQCLWSLAEHTTFRSCDHTLSDCSLACTHSLTSLHKMLGVHFSGERSVVEVWACYPSGYQHPKSIYPFIFSKSSSFEFLASLEMSLSELLGSRGDKPRQELVFNLSSSFGSPWDGTVDQSNAYPFISQISSCGRLLDNIKMEEDGQQDK